MLFCWLEAPQRTKVDEVHSLLQQISSNTAGASTAAGTSATPGDTIAAFEQKWEHLMPNQTRERAESTEDTLDRASASSEDSDLLDEIKLEAMDDDLTAPAPAPQAPPRGGRKKVEVAVSVAEPEVKEVATKKEKAEKAAASPSRPQPSVSASASAPQAAKSSAAPKAETTIKSASAPVPARKAPPRPTPAPTKAPVPEAHTFTPLETKESTKPSEITAKTKEEKNVTAEPTVPIPASVAAAAPEIDFTEFTSHETLDKPQIAKDFGATDDLSAGDFTGFASHETPDSPEVDFFGSPDVSLVGVSTPDKATSAQKISTPIGTTESSPTLSSMVASPSSSASFITAVSSPGASDVYATASDSTLVVTSPSTDVAHLSPDISGNMSSTDTSFEVLETTTVPSVLDDIGSSPLDKSQNALSQSQSQDLFSATSAPTSNQNPFSDTTVTNKKEDAIGIEDSQKDTDFTSASVPSKPDTSANDTEFFSFMIEPADVTEAESSKSVSAVSEANPFVSFGTDLSSLSSLTTPEVHSDVSQQPGFPSFTSNLSSLSSLDTGSSAALSATPQSEPPSVDFGFEQGNEAPASSSNPSALSSGLGDFSFDMLASSGSQDSEVSKEPDDVQMPDVLADLGTGKTAAENQSSGPTQGTVADDLFSLQEPKSHDGAPSSGAGDSQSGMQSGESSHAPTNDLFDFDGLSAHKEGSASLDSFEVIDTSISSGDQKASNNPFADLEFLSGSSSTPATSDDASKPSLNPFSLEGMSDFAGVSQSTTTSDESAEKVGNGMHDGSASFSGEASASSSSSNAPTSETETFSSTDNTDNTSTTNSDSGKDYVCDEAWGEEEAEGGAGRCSPPPASPTSSMDSEELELQLAAQIYLSRGLTMSRSFEIPAVLEPIPEHPAPSLSEESAVPTPSETSSVDVRFEEVFEWDDFMEESLVAKDRNASLPESPKQNDLSDWTMDSERESVGSSISSQHSEPVKGVNRTNDSRTLEFHETPTSVYSTEQTLQEPVRTVQRSFIADLIASRTKGLSLSTTPQTAAASRPNKFYSFYEEDFDLELDSPSDDNDNPPVIFPVSEHESHSQRLVPDLPADSPALHDELPLPTVLERSLLSAPANTQVCHSIH
jgi:hypothetical protein